MAAKDRRPRIRRRAYLALLLSLFGACVLFGAAYVSHVRWDLSEGQIYTLSSSTRALLAKLDEPIEIRAYVTSGLPQPYGRLRRFLEDMLRAYHEAGHGKIGFDVIDPSGNPNQAAALQAMHIPRVQVQVVEDDQARVKQGYLAVVVEYLDKKAVIPVVKNETGFEYTLTSKIKQLTGKGRKTIGVVAGFGAKPLDALQQFSKMVASEYKLVPVHPDKKPIPEDVQALIVPQFEKPPSKVMRYALDQFRMSGRGMLILAGNVEPQLNLGFRVRAVDAKANAWLRDIGISVEPGLVMDPSASRVTVNQSQGVLTFRSIVDYPFLPRVTDINGDTPVGHGLKAVSVPFASPLVWTDDTHGTVLLRSSPDAAVQHGPDYDVDPLVSMKKRFEGLARRQVNLALELDGTAHSAFDAAPAAASDVVKVNRMTQAGHQRVIVVGSGSLLDNEFVDGNNKVLILNSLDWLSHDERLISLRTRGITDRPLPQLSSAVRKVWKGIWMFGLPFLVVLIGMWRWRRIKRASVGRVA